MKFPLDFHFSPIRKLHFSINVPTLEEAIKMTERIKETSLTQYN